MCVTEAGGTKRAFVQNRAGETSWRSAPPVVSNFSSGAFPETRACIFADETRRNVERSGEEERGGAERKECERNDRGSRAQGATRAARQLFSGSSRDVNHIFNFAAQR